MRKILTALAFAVALPSIAHAQSTPSPEKKMDCCEKMKAEGKKCCCDDMAKKDGHAEHDRTHAGAAEKHAD